MEINELKKQVLLMANEDYSGLWEGYEEAKSLYGDLTTEKIIHYSSKALLDLVELELIQFYFCKEPLTNEKVTPVAPEQVGDVLSEQKYWVPPQKNALSVRFATTLKRRRSIC